MELLGLILYPTPTADDTKVKHYYRFSVDTGFKRD